MNDDDDKDSNYLRKSFHVSELYGSKNILDSEKDVVQFVFCDLEYSHFELKSMMDTHNTSNGLKFRNKKYRDGLEVKEKLTELNTQPQYANGKILTYNEFNFLQFDLKNNEINKNGFQNEPMDLPENNKSKLIKLCKNAFISSLTTDTTKYESDGVNSKILSILRDLIVLDNVVFIKYQDEYTGEEHKHDPWFVFNIFATINEDQYSINLIKLYDYDFYDRYMDIIVQRD